MICPTCGHVYLPGSEECSCCQQDLTQLDRPTAHNPVERSLMEDTVQVLRPRRPDPVGDTAAPHRADQIVLGADVAAIFDQVDQKIEHLRLDRDALAAARQFAKVDIEHMV